MDNRTLKVIRSRTSTRQYLPKKVPLSKVLAVLEAGKYAPSGMNRQICSVLCVRKKSYVDKLIALGKELTGRANYYDASTIILVYGPKDDPFTKLDGSCILENMFIAAESLGLGSCWINQSEQLLSDPKGLRLRKSLGIKDTDYIVGTCILGYKASENTVKPRREDLVRII